MDKAAEEIISDEDTSFDAGLVQQNSELAKKNKKKFSKVENHHVLKLEVYKKAKLVLKKKCCWAHKTASSQQSLMTNFSTYSLQKLIPHIVYWTKWNH